MIRLGLLGASGKMGHLVQDIIKTEHASECVLAATSDQDHKNFNQVYETNVVIDFSIPEAVEDFLKTKPPSKNLPALVIGSTGWKDISLLKKYSKQAPVLMSSNFSIGVFATHVILKKSSELLKNLGYKPSIIDIHHIHKRDAPSGTALALQKTLAESFSSDDIPIESLREGEIIGDHQNVFEKSGDKIIIRHFAKDRSIFARGAIETALWLAQEYQINPSLKGMLSMDDFFKKKYGHLF